MRRPVTGKDVIHRREVHASVTRPPGPVEDFPQWGQAQDSLEDQMRRVRYLAVRHGEYDAADFIQRTFFDQIDGGL